MGITAEIGRMKLPGNSPVIRVKLGICTMGIEVSPPSQVVARESAGKVLFGTLKEELMFTPLEMHFVQPSFERPFRRAPYFS